MRPRPARAGDFFNPPSQENEPSDNNNGSHAIIFLSGTVIVCNIFWITYMVHQHNEHMNQIAERDRKLEAMKATNASPTTNPIHNV